MLADSEPDHLSGHEMAEGAQVGRVITHGRWSAKLLPVFKDFFVTKKARLRNDVSRAIELDVRVPP